MHLRVKVRFPQHYAAASLKPVAAGSDGAPVDVGFPQHYAAASLKLLRPVVIGWSTRRFPQHYAAASLKRQ